MSTTPNGFNLKSFWQKPEGKYTGTGFLLLGGSVAIYEFYSNIDTLILYAQDTIHLGILCGIIGLSFALLSSKNFRALVSNSFQLIMRSLTSIAIELDPIGIEKNYRDKMEEEKVKLDKGVEGCAGAKEGLEQSINKNNKVIQHDKALLDELERELATERNAMRANSLKLKKQQYLVDIGRKIDTNKNLQKTLDMTNGLYERSQRMQQLAEYNIENLNGQIENDEQERTAILEAYKALGPMQKLIRGEPDALKMFNAAREFAAKDNSRMLGAMKDFSAYSEKYLTGMDIEQGANAAEAEKMFSQIEQTMQLTAGVQEAVPSRIVRKNADAVLVEKSNNAVSGDYLDTK